VALGVRLPRGLSSGFAEKAMAAGCGIPGLDGAMRGLLAARDAILKAIVAINTDMKSLERSSSACRRLMTIPGVGRLTALAFAAAIDDPDRFRRSRDVGAYLGLVPRRYQSGEIDYTGSISKCGDARLRTLLYEAANVMLTRYRGSLALKHGRSTLPGDQRCARRGLRSRAVCCRRTRKGVQFELTNRVDKLRER
jgi:transposase